MEVLIPYAYGMGRTFEFAQPLKAQFYRTNRGWYVMDIKELNSIDYMCEPAEEPHSIPWDKGYSREGATAFVKDHGWAPSMIGTAGNLMSGVEYCAETEK